MSSHRLEGTPRTYGGLFERNPATYHFPIPQELIAALKNVVATGNQASAAWLKSRSIL